MKEIVQAWLQAKCSSRLLITQRHICLWLSCCILFFCAFPSATFAEDTNSSLRSMREQIRKTELQLQFLKKTYKVFRNVGNVSLTKRLSDGQINFLLKDYLRASIVLLEAVENPRNKGKSAWFDAAYYLAESLYRSRNYSGAGKYFKLLVRYKRKHSNKALIRLMDLASKTKQYKWVNQYFQSINQLPAGQLRDKIYYLRAKITYNQGRFLEARKLFLQIGSNNVYGARAQYFLGVIALQTQSKEQSIPAATTRLLTAIRMLSPKKAKKLRDITLLSLGRLYLEQKKVNQALNYYRKIDRRSHVFDQALYETCWSYIRRGQSFKNKKRKRKEYKRALQTLEIMLAFLPQSPFYPKAQLLQGHLQLQLAPFERKEQGKMFNEALNSYQKIASRYRGVYREMDQLIQSRTNPRAFFRDLISRQLDQFRVASVIPKDAARWMSSEALMGRTLNMLRDLRQMKEMLSSNKQIIQRLESALSLGDQVDLSPTLKDARLRGTSIRNQLIQMQRSNNLILLGLVSSKMSTSERAVYQSMQRKLSNLRLLFMRTPKNTKELKSRSKAVQKRIKAMTSRMHNITIKLDYAVRYLKTVRRWLISNPDAQKLTTSQRNQLRADTNQLELQIRNLREEHANLSHRIDLSNISLGYASANPQEASIQAQYQALLLKEKRLLARLKQRLSPQQRQQMSEIQNNNKRFQQYRNRLREFFLRLSQQSMAFRRTIQQKLAGEKLKLKQYQIKVTSLEQESKGLASKVAYNSFISVRKKFYDLVLRAEVGVIDVAWREKQTIQSEKLRLTKEKNRELKVLDSEFRDLLQEVK